MLILYLCNVFRITIFLDLNTQEKMKETTMEMYSPHFSKQEMQRSGMAIRLGIENKPDREEEENLKALCLNVLEPLRKRFGRIIITSVRLSTFTSPTKKWDGAIFASSNMYSTMINCSLSAACQTVACGFTWAIAEIGSTTDTRQLKWTSESKRFAIFQLEKLS